MIMTGCRSAGTGGALLMLLLLVGASGAQTVDTVLFLPDSFVGAISESSPSTPKYLTLPGTNIG